MDQSQLFAVIAVIAAEGSSFVMCPHQIFIICSRLLSNLFFFFFQLTIILNKVSGSISSAHL